MKTEMDSSRNRCRPLMKSHLARDEEQSVDLYRA